MLSEQAVDEWTDLGDTEDDEDIQVDEYDISASANDFNTMTIISFMDAGSLRIPGFQRNYVWDLRRASRLIESLVLGLPVPQTFLYEEARNRFLIIDGQQRLLSIYFFAKQRFPRRNKRADLRKIINESGVIPDSLLQDDEYFENFNLRLGEPQQPNRFNRLNYATLGEYRTQLDLRPIRNIILKQLSPSEDDSSVYEIFQRLNTGGVNLRPQEIRAAMYHSDLYEMLSRVNLLPSWRALLGQPDPDNNLRDVEILLRALAMYETGGTFASSMKQFLNAYSKQARQYKEEKVRMLEERLIWFFTAMSEDEHPGTIFQVRRGNKFTVTIFEAAFAASAHLRDRETNFWPDPARIRSLRDDPQMAEYSFQHSNLTTNVSGRLNRAIQVLGSE